MKILIIEDEPGIAQALHQGLMAYYRTSLVATGRDGLELALDNHFDAILLDLGLPDLSGLEVCRQLRNSGSTTPILVLTGQGDTQTKVSLLDNGANDYLTKPFPFDELKARLRVLMRHRPTAASSTIKVGEVTLDTASRQVSRGKHTIPLRRKEYELLEFLMRHNSLVVTRNMILNHVWPSDSDSFANVVDVHIKNLRDQLDRPFAQPYIKTIYGLGYKFEQPDSKLVAELPLSKEAMPDERTTQE
jgi:two-component system OmpR family response regulator